jgi:polyvinyl alcohol dehydrogenase (cytochrome)
MRSSSQYLGWALFALLPVGSVAGCSDAPAAPPGPIRDGGVDSSTPLPALDCSSHGTEWAFYGGDVCNTRSTVGNSGITRATAARLGVRWVASFEGDVTATPAVVDGQVYVPDWSGRLTRIDAATGNVVWSKKVADLAGLPSPSDGGTPDGGAVDEVVSRMTPIVANGAVMFGLFRQGFSSLDSLAYFVAVDRDSGALRWKTLVDTHRAAVLTGPPVLDGGRIYLGVSSREEALALEPSFKCTFRGSVVALDAATGAMIWKTPMIDDRAYFLADGTTPSGWAGSAIWSGTPAIDRKRGALYVTTGNNYSAPPGAPALPDGNHVESIVALDLGTGAVQWASRMTMGDLWTYGMAVFNDPQIGPDWDFGAGANLFTARIDGRARDLVGAGQKSGIYWAVDADNGSLVWKTQVGPGGHLGGIHWGTAVEGGRVHVGVNNETGMPYPLRGEGATAGQETAVGSWAALDTASGKMLWQVANPTMTAPLNQTSVNAPPSAVNGVVFHGSMDAAGTMLALDATTGAVLWSFESGGTVYSAPAIANDTVYWGCGAPPRIGFGTPCKKLYAFEVR